METNKRIFPSTQLCVALDAKVLKLYLWILSWASKGDVKYYVKQFAKACKLTEDEVDRCIQALINSKLIIVTNNGDGWMIKVNAEQNQKYYDVPLSKVLEGDGIQMADDVNWNSNESALKNFSSISDEQLERMIQELQRRRKEKNDVDNLPW